VSYQISFNKLKEELALPTPTDIQAFDTITKVQDLMIKNSKA
jgi:hypothetical protein